MRGARCSPATPRARRAGICPRACRTRASQPLRRRCAKSVKIALALEPASLDELGLYDYLPAKRLHLYALRVAVDAFEIGACRCHTSFPHHASGLPTLEVDAYAWKPLDRVDAWCGKNMTRVLLALDWPRIERLPEVAAVPVRSR